MAAFPLERTPFGSLIRILEKVTLFYNAPERLTDAISRGYPNAGNAEKYGQFFSVD